MMFTLSRRQHQMVKYVQIGPFWVTATHYGCWKVPAWSPTSDGGDMPNLVKFSSFLPIYLQQDARSTVCSHVTNPFIEAQAVDMMMQSPFIHAFYHWVHHCDHGVSAQARASSHHVPRLIRKFDKLILDQEQWNLPWFYHPNAKPVMLVMSSRISKYIMNKLLKIVITLGKWPIFSDFLMSTFKMFWL